MNVRDKISELIEEFECNHRDRNPTYLLITNDIFMNIRMYPDNDLIQYEVSNIDNKIMSMSVMGIEIVIFPHGEKRMKVI